MIMSNTLNSCFTAPLTSGIFAVLNTKSVPWAGTTTANPLDLVYHGNHSGNKQISPLVDALLDTSGKLDNTSLGALCDSIVAIYGHSWSKLYTTLSLQYNPISNYDMTETEETEGENETNYTGTDTLTKIGTQTTERTGTDNHETSQTVDNDATTNNSMYAVNSVAAVPTDAHTGTTDSETTGSDNETVNLTDELTHNTTDTQTKNLTDSGTHSTTRELTRSGNIGVTTSQQMIESEIQLWQWKFFTQVFNDLDEVLTLHIY